MKIPILDAKKAKVGEQELPVQFSEPVREDLITRAVLALQATRRQPYGGYGNAGMRHSAELSKRRRDYRGSYGKGQSRTPRKVHTRRGRQMYFVGAEAPQTVGGRRAHGPKPFKDWEQKINKTENRKAIRAALAATLIPEVVSARGHKVPEGFPFLIANDFESLNKTVQLESALVALGLAEEMVRADRKKVRAGKGTMRGRRYKRPQSVLFVVSQDETELAKAASNLPGCEVVAVHRLNAELLAPGTNPGRLTLYTQGAIERLASEGLFTRTYKGGAGEDVVVAKKAPAKKAPAKKAVAKKAAKKVVEVSA